MKRALILGVMLFALVGFGEPATKPSTQPAGESFPALQKKLRDLMDKNTELQARVEELRSRLATVQAELAKANLILKPPAAGESITTTEALMFAVKTRLKVGMTEAEAIAAIGKPKERNFSGQSITLVYDITDYHEATPGRALPGRHYHVDVTISNGVVSQIWDDSDIPIDRNPPR